MGSKLFLMLVLAVAAQLDEAPSLLGDGQEVIARQSPPAQAANLGSMFR